MKRLLAVVALAAICGYRVFAQSYTIAPSPFLTEQDNSGNIVNNGCIWTYQAGTSTPATTYLDNAGTPNSNPIRSDSAGRFTVYLVTGSSYKFIYEGACTPPAHGTVFRTADNISSTPSASATVDYTVTAGETISAGNCAYVSDGSGGKNTGQAYKCDSGNTYSSSAPIAGLAPSAITVGATGTLRAHGIVTGLAVASGSSYFVGLAGALTTTAPSNKRYIGVADTPTSLMVEADPRPLPLTAGSSGFTLTSQGATSDVTWSATPFIDDFRLSLTSATCVTTSDVTAATTIFWTSCTGNRIALFDSNGNIVTATSGELTLPVPANVSTMNDVFVFLNSGVPALEALAWTNDTTRATALVRREGHWVKSGDFTRMYLGSVRTTTVNGQTEDSGACGTTAKRYVWNLYNQRPRQLCHREATASWNYTLAAYEQARGSTTNQVDAIVGIAGEAWLDLWVHGAASNSTNNASVTVDIGIGNTTNAASTADVVTAPGAILANMLVAVKARLSTYPAVGRQFYTWLESSQAVGTTTWFGTNSSNYGLDGWIQG